MQLSFTHFKEMGLIMSEKEKPPQDTTQKDYPNDIIDEEYEGRDWWKFFMVIAFAFIIVIGYYIIKGIFS